MYKSQHLTSVLNMAQQMFKTAVLVVQFLFCVLILRMLNIALLLKAKATNKGKILAMHTFFGITLTWTELFMFTHVCCVLLFLFLTVTLQHCILFSSVLLLFAAVPDLVLTQSSTGDWNPLHKKKMFRECAQVRKFSLFWHYSSLFASAQVLNNTTLQVT